MPLEFVYRENHKVERTLSGVTCCKCGQVGKWSEPLATRSIPEGFHVLRCEGGFGDTFPGDGEVLTIVVCEDCLREWVGTFKHRDVFGTDTITAKHCDTLEEHTIDGPWFFPVGTDYPKGLEDPHFGDVPYPEQGTIWEHFKGKRYQVLGLAWDTGAQVPHVVYLALYGDSDVWLRPLSEWEDTIDRETYQGPRFKQIA